MGLCYFGLRLPVSYIMKITPNCSNATLTIISILILISCFWLQNAVTVWTKRKRKINGRCQRRNSATNDIMSVHFSRYVSSVDFRLHFFGLSDGLSIANGIRNNVYLISLVLKFVKIFSTEKKYFRLINEFQLQNFVIPDTRQEKPRPTSYDECFNEY